MIPLFLLFVMCQNNNKKEETLSVLPSDTIPMQYSPDYPNFRMLILDGIVNNSLHFKVFFDTHTGGNSFSISDSLKNFFVSDSAFVRIGRLKKQMQINYLRSDQRNFFNEDALGKNSILVGWQFFENKIIEFDFQNQRILVYEELPDITEYSKTKITLSGNSTDNYALLIPTQVAVEGKTLEDSVIIDTGHNGYITLSSEYIRKQGILTIHSSFEKSTTCSILLADTIKIGDLYVANQNMNILCSNRSLGLLGTKTLENFSVILDLINYDLYLKKIDN